MAHSRQSESHARRFDSRLSGKTIVVEEFEADNLLRLLRTYETAIAELQKLQDPAFTDLIARYTKRRAEVFAALADRNIAAIAAIRSFGS
jgi:hypothetical protein